MELPSELPIETVRGPLLASLERSRHFVLQAEPGAGKTTRVPVMLDQAGVASDGDIVVAQPRRLAARMAANRVARTLAEPVGQSCGYQVRFDAKFGPQTRIRFVTEGLLLRRLRDDPSLRGTRTVILDEFHERHIGTDVALALLVRLAQRRPQLRIGVMSATLEPGPVARFLGCEPLHCAGRAFPVEVTHVEKATDRPLPTQVGAALRELARAGLDGSVLVFLPGAGEIRACAKHLEQQASHLGLETVMLYGDLSAAEQDRAIRPGTTPKLILSTNVAETSVTIEHVCAVIDTGLARSLSHNPWTGIPTLALAKISRASADQRAGRAGRTKPGRCLRLFTRHDFERRPQFDPPELHRLDLAAAMLDLRAAGLRSTADLEWLEPPPDAAVGAAETLLSRLGAVARDGSLTPTGHAMARHPVHPRLARVLEDARVRGIPALGATACALLAERPIRRQVAAATRTVRSATSDVLDEAEDLAEWAHRGRSAATELGLDPAACAVVQRVERQLLRSLGIAHRAGPPTLDEEAALSLALLSGFPDRVGRLRRGASGAMELVFAEGRSATLDARSCVRDAELAVALAVDERRGRSGPPKTVIRSAASVDLSGLLEVFADDLVEHRVVAFNPASERVEASEEVRLGALVVETSTLRELPPEAPAVLFEAAVAKGLHHLAPNCEALEARTRFAHRFDTTVPVLDAAALLETLKTVCVGRRSFAELREANLVGRALDGIPPRSRASLERLAPTHVVLAGGRRLAVHYASDRDPWVQSRLQDFFGLSQGPTVGGGRIPLVLHLLAPNMRAVQVSTDLAGFWERHYPAQRRVLMRRYPKHDWPEFPLQATPPSPRPGRGRRRPR